MSAVTRRDSLLKKEFFKHLLQASVMSGPCWRGWVSHSPCPQAASAIQSHHLSPRDSQPPPTGLLISTNARGMRYFSASGWRPWSSAKLAMKALADLWFLPPLSPVPSLHTSHPGWLNISNSLGLSSQDHYFIFIAHTAVAFSLHWALF